MRTPVVAVAATAVVVVAAAALVMVMIPVRLTAVRSGPYTLAFVERDDVHLERGATLMLCDSKRVYLSGLIVDEYRTLTGFSAGVDEGDGVPVVRIVDAERERWRITSAASVCFGRDCPTGDSPPGELIGQEMLVPLATRAPLPWSALLDLCQGRCPSTAGRA